MTPQQTQPLQQERGIKRCAVCKIDLKGRLVLINDEAEKIFGYSKEELFGRYLGEFLDEPDQIILQQMLRQRNHYDSFFETTTITLIDADQARVHVKIILSLNFIAGNPVNYQIIINNDEGTESGNTAESPNSPLDQLLKLSVTSQWFEFCKLIGEITSASKVACYHISGREQDSVSHGQSLAVWSSDGRSLELPTSALHLACAETSQPYDCTNHDDVQQAIERHTVAPHELVFPLHHDSMTNLICRLIFDDTIAPEIIREARSSCVRIFKSLDLHQGSTRQVQSTVKSSSRLGDLFAIAEQLSIGIALFDGNGQMREKNSIITNLTGGYPQGASFEAVVASLLPEMNELDRARVDKFLYEAQSSDTMQLTSTTGIISLVRSENPTASFQASIIVLPGTFLQSKHDINEFAGSAFLEALSKQLQSSSDTMSTISDTLHHKYFDELNGDGELLLKQLNAQTDKVRLMTGEMHLLAQVLHAPERPQTVDLGLLVQQAIGKLSAERPNLRFATVLPSLPKVQVPRQIVALILDSILSQISSHAIQGDIAVQFTCKCIESNLYFAVIHADQTPTQRQLEKAFCLSRISTTEQAPPARLSLLASRELARALGGTLTARALPKQGVEYQLTLPLKAGI